MKMPFQGRGYGIGNCMKEGRLGVNPNNLVISKLHFEITRLLNLELAFKNLRNDTPFSFNQVKCFL